MPTTKHFLPLPKLCIFCGKAGRLTKEHIISRWIQEEIGTTHVNTEHVLRRNIAFESIRSRTVASLNGRMCRPGDPLSLTLRVVCRNCNEGWMSSLVQRAKPHIRPLLTGDWSQFTCEAAEPIASWLALTVMVYEFADPTTQVIGSEEREFMFLNHQIPPDWRAWIGENNDGVSFNFHRAGTVGKPIYIGSTDIPFDTQGTIFAAGKFFGHIVSTRNRFLSLSRFEHPLGNMLAPVWPERFVSVGHPASNLSSSSAERFQDVLFAALTKKYELASQFTFAY